MATFRQLIDLIALDLSSSTNNLLETEIKDAINRAHEDFQNDRFTFNEDRTTFSTTALQAEYPKAANWPRVLQIDQVQYLQAGHLYRLERETYEWYVEALVNQSSQVGPSNRYAIFANIMFLYPQPDQITSVTISGIHALVTDGGSSLVFTNDSDTNAFLEGQALQMMRSRAKADIYANRLNNLDMAEAQNAIAKQYRTGLITDANRLHMDDTTKLFYQF